MSQYPSPYPPSPYAQPPIDYSSYQPAGDLLGPARRAGVLMIVLGGLVTLLALCDLGLAIFISGDELAQQQAAMANLVVPPAQLSPETMRLMAGIFAGVRLLVGLAFIVDGAYVRRGSPAATTVGLVLTGAVGLLVALLVALSLLAALAAPPLAALACLLSVPLALLAWAFVWLLAALRHGPRLAAARQQYAVQYYQLQQQQTAYAPAGGYGMPHAPPQGYGYAAPPQYQPQSQTPYQPGQFPPASLGPGSPTPWSAPVPPASQPAQTPQQSAPPSPQEPTDPNRIPPADPNGTAPPAA